MNSPTRRPDLRRASAKAAREARAQETAERRRAEAEEDRRLAEATKLSGGGGTSGRSSNGSNFFAFDDKKLKKGRRDFEKRWRDRSLEDNWRRSSRRELGEEVAGADAEQIDRELTQADIDKAA